MYIGSAFWKWFYQSIILYLKFKGPCVFPKQLYSYHFPFIIVKISVDKLYPGSPSTVGSDFEWTKKIENYA